MRHFLLFSANIVYTIAVTTALVEARIISLSPDQTGSYPTIQAAIDASNPGDEIVLEPGIYTGSGNYNLGFSPTSGNSFSTGGRPKMIEREIENQAALTALTKLTPEGTNFGLDKEAWKNWYSRIRNGEGKSLRRRE